MTTIEIIKENAMNLPQIKAELEKIKKRDKELGYRSQQVPAGHLQRSRKHNDYLLCRSVHLHCPFWGN